MQRKEKCLLCGKQITFVETTLIDYERGPMTYEEVVGGKLFDVFFPDLFVRHFNLWGKCPVCDDCFPYVEGCKPPKTNIYNKKCEEIKSKLVSLNSVKLYCLQKGIEREEKESIEREKIIESKNEQINKLLKELVETGRIMGLCQAVVEELRMHKEQLESKK